jgi:redox-sensitive bicupin YhaK (pirin superfamily)
MIDLVIDSRRKDLGGFEVGRVLPYPRHRMVGPFIFFDHMGPAKFDPGANGIDVRPHPHIGLSTVTYLFEGRILHHDSLGYTQPITPGEVNWMTAGRGIVHSERTEAGVRATGGAMHGIQAWIALPTEAEEMDPAFSHHGEAELPTYDADGLWARLIAGSAYGVTARPPTQSPLFYVHWELEPGVSAGLPEGYSESAVFVAKGRVEIDGQTLSTGQMAVFAKGARGVVKALLPSTVMALGGEPVGERFLWWNLVSSSKDRIEQAKADWTDGRMPLPPADDGEFIPLPHDIPPPAPEPMS